jgi:hypothetical protein
MPGAGGALAALLTVSTALADAEDADGRPSGSDREPCRALCAPGLGYGGLEGPM